VAQLCGLGAALEALLLTQCALVLEQNAEPFRATERGTLRVIGHIPEAFGHAVQSEVVQQVECGMSEQRSSPQW
jgi:hypothetical protein